MFTRSKMAFAIAVALPCSAGPQLAAAAVLEFSWQGQFIILDQSGSAMANAAISSKSNNRYVTPISGTLAYDPYAGLGSATVMDFDWGNFSYDIAPAQFSAFDLRAIGDGSGGAGSLMLGNLLFNWDGNNGVPVSVVLDATGFLGNLSDFVAGGPGTTLTGVGAVPASDGTYVGANVPGAPSGNGGYLQAGPTPIATTSFDTTGLCTRPGQVADGACLGLNPSGGLPLRVDTAHNPHDFVIGTGSLAREGIGGSPAPDGPVAAMNLNFDFTQLTLTSACSTCSLVSEVPLPAALWLFGSGLLSLMGLGRVVGR